MSAKRVSALRALAATLVAVVGLLVATQPLAAQSLADVAKKEGDRRETIRVPAKVYTNKDLNPAVAGSSPPAAAKTADAKDGDKPAKDGTAKDASGDKDKSVPKDQAYWAGRLKTLQDALLRDQNYADAMQTRINTLTADFVNRDDPVQKGVIERNRQKAVAELARLNKSVTDTKQGIADLLEEARRAGVPPLWMR